jgi:hypothetical protein
VRTFYVRIEDNSLIRFVFEPEPAHLIGSLTGDFIAQCKYFERLHSKDFGNQLQIIWFFTTGAEP